MLEKNSSYGRGSLLVPRTPRDGHYFSVLFDVLAMDVPRIELPCIYVIN
jgi:hypothetical protein